MLGLFSQLVIWFLISLFFFPSLVLFLMYRSTWAFLEGATLFIAKLDYLSIAASASPAAFIQENLLISVLLQRSLTLIQRFLFAPLWTVSAARRLFAWPSSCISRCLFCSVTLTHYEALTHALIQSDRPHRLSRFLFFFCSLFYVPSLLRLDWMGMHGWHRKKEGNR